MQFEIKTLLSTPLATNNYLLVGNDFAVLVEATASVEQIEERCTEESLTQFFSHIRILTMLQTLKTF